jgi:hypothetical protein
MMKPLSVEAAKLFAFTMRGTGHHYSENGNSAATTSHHPKKWFPFCPRNEVFVNFSTTFPLLLFSTILLQKFTNLELT